MEEDSKIQLLKLSASSVKTYESCPLKYYWTYIDKKPKKQWDHFTLGNFCHKILENFHSDLIENPGLDKKLLMKKYFEEAMVVFKMKQPALVEAKEMLVNYLKYFNENPSNVLSVEKSFNFNINENILIRGFIDRLDIDDNGMYHIIDYKTSKDGRYMTPFQLKVYGIWLRKEYGVENYKGSYIMLRNSSQPISYSFTSKDIDECEQEIINYAEKIKESTTIQNWQPLPTFLCKFCDFYDICPAQKSW